MASFMLMRFQGSFESMLTISSSVQPEVDRDSGGAVEVEGDFFKEVFVRDHHVVVVQ